MDVLQWWHRLDLAEGGELLMRRALWREVVEKCLERCYDLPPNLLYAKVGSQECSPSWLQIESVWINPRRVLIRLGLFLRVFILYAKLYPWAAPSWFLHGPCDSFDGYPSWAESPEANIEDLFGIPSLAIDMGITERKNNKARARMRGIGS
jgi:hypothetical protein